LNLSDSVRLKLNGTFKRCLFLIDESDCLHKVIYKIQTALWFDETAGKWTYVSIFPKFIKRWYQSCLHLLEYISCKVRKGEDILVHIDDPKEILLCEDRIAVAIKRLEKHCIKINCEALLNSKYTQIFNRPLPEKGFGMVDNMRFHVLHSLIHSAGNFFGLTNRVLSLVNGIIRL